jgi:hypothetical protein
MQEFFDSIPQDQWEIKEPAFIKRLGILIRSLILFPPRSRSIPAACAGVIPFGNPQAKGMSQIEIAHELQVSKASITSDVQYLREQAKGTIKEYVTEHLPEQYQICLSALDTILKHAFVLVYSDITLVILNESIIC